MKKRKEPTNIERMKDERKQCNQLIMREGIERKKEKTTCDETERKENTKQKYKKNTKRKVKKREIQKYRKRNKV